jgi:hypothetical protein
MMPPHHNKKRKTVPGTDDNDAEQHGTHPHVYEHLLVGWIVRVYRKGGGRWHPSTRPQPLRALARRVDRVLTATPPHNDDEQYSTRPPAFELLLVGWVTGAVLVVRSSRLPHVCDSASRWHTGFFLLTT